MGTTFCIWELELTPTQTLELHLGDLRRKLAESIGAADPDHEAIEKLTGEIRQVDINLTAQKLLEPEVTKVVTDTLSPEDRELAELRGKVDFGKYVGAALAGMPIMGGPELEYNQHIGLAANYFPLELIGAGLEERAIRDLDAQGNQGTWLDRVFAESAAARIGISMPVVAPGVAAYPVMSAGASGAQRGRTEATAEGTFTVKVTELKPSRHSVYGIYSIEDELRLPGMAEAIIRDMRAAIVESMDKAILTGDSGANETAGDITGLRTHADVTEVTITQNNKVKGDELLKLFLGFVDGVYATSMADVRMVASVGSNTLWGGTVHNSAASNETVAAFLRANGVSWMVRDGIDPNTANGDFGAYIGLARGADGAGVAPIWNQAQLIRDEFGARATQGEVGLTLNAFWNFGLVRANNFKRLKYVSN